MDTSNINEVSPEEKVSRGWVDFSFLIGNVPRFFVETKKVNEDLDRVRKLEKHIAQVDAEIDRRVYALYRLTEEEIKIVEGTAQT